MATDKFITLEQLDQTTQALLYKINEKADTKVDIENVNAILNSGVKIATIDEIDIYAPPGEVTEQDLSNAVYNIYSAMDNSFANLASVASTGSYEDLTDKPTIPSKTSDLTNDSGFITSNNVDTSTFMVKGTDYVTAGKKSGTTLGLYATAEGTNNTASGLYSHAEGYTTIAAGSYGSHAEGQNSNASGDAAHAEGGNTTASGTTSHAEGSYTTASGTFSHAEGWYTTAQRRSQHVFGEYNVLDVTGTTATRGQYVEIVGNGTANNFRANARTLDWLGNETLAGKLTLGAAPTANMDAATKQYVDNLTVTKLKTTAAVSGSTYELIGIDASDSQLHAETVYTPSHISFSETSDLSRLTIGDMTRTGTILFWKRDVENNRITATYLEASNTMNGGGTLLLPGGDGTLALTSQIPTAETNSAVEDMLDSYNLDYTSNSVSANMWSGGSY